MNEQELVKEAIAALGLNVPYYRVEVEVGEKHNQVVFYLYGGGVTRFVAKKQPVTALPQPVVCPEGPIYGNHDGDSPANFTWISGVGLVTSRKLNAAGYLSIHDLMKASEDDLALVVGAATAAKIIEQLPSEGG
jgi:hypothetical protein